MKIIIDARESGTSTGRYVDKLIEYLHKLQPAEEIVILTKAHRLDFIGGIAPRFTVLESPFKEFTFGEQLGLKKQLDQLRPDLVHFGMVQQPILYRGQIVTTMHDLTTTRFKNPDKNPLIFAVKQRLYQWVNKRAARKSAQLITPSMFVKQDVASFAGVSSDKITVTYEAADQISEAAEPFPSLQDKTFIMYVGRPTPHKNLERLVQAFSLLKATHPALVLVLAGKKDANYERIAAEVARRQLPDVMFTDFISEGQLRWLYEHCAAYVFPSLSEGFGLPGLEAMAHGAPVVSSSATCLPEIYGEAAHYFDPLDVTDMVNKIAAVLDNPALRTQLIAKGRAQVKQYSWQRMAEQTLAVYRRVLKTP